MTDDLRAAEALRALVQIDETRIDDKSNVDAAPHCGCAWAPVLTPVEGPA